MLQTRAHGSRTRPSSPPALPAARSEQGDELAHSAILAEIVERSQTLAPRGDLAPINNVPGHDRRPEHLYAFD